MQCAASRLLIDSSDYPSARRERESRESKKHGQTEKKDSSEQKEAEKEYEK